MMTPLEDSTHFYLRKPFPIIINDTSLKMNFLNYKSGMKTGPEQRVKDTIPTVCNLST